MVYIFNFTQITPFLYFLDSFPLKKMQPNSSVPFDAGQYSKKLKWDGSNGFNISPLNVSSDTNVASLVSNGPNFLPFSRTGPWTGPNSSIPSTLGKLSNQLITYPMKILSDSFSGDKSGEIVIACKQSDTQLSIYSKATRVYTVCSFNEMMKKHSKDLRSASEVWDDYYFAGISLNQIGTKRDQVGSKYSSTTATVLKFGFAEVKNVWGPESTIMTPLYLIFKRRNSNVFDPNPPLQLFAYSSPSTPEPPESVLEYSTNEGIKYGVPVFIGYSHAKNPTKLTGGESLVEINSSGPLVSVIVK